MTSKKPRRGPGEGSIYQRKDGRFVASLPIDGPGRPRKYFYGKTRAEVREKLKMAQLEQKQGTLATGPRQTVQQFLDHWLENVHKYRVRLNTYRIYRQLLNGHVLPALGHVQLQKLSPQRVQELYAQSKKRDTPRKRCAASTGCCTGPLKTLSSGTWWPRMCVIK